MICPLYDFCKQARNDHQCSGHHENCGKKRKLKNWIKEIIAEVQND